MRRAVTVLLSAALLATTLTVTIVSTVQASAPRGARIQLQSTALGKILTNGRGFTLYMFTTDMRNHNMCLGIRGCPSVWPALATSGKPLAGSGVKTSLLGMINVGSGKRQVTYAGHPLYTYSGDTGPRSTAYVGFRQFGGSWYALRAAGSAVR